MAASSSHSGASTPSSTASGQESPTDTTKLMSNGGIDSAPRFEVHRWIFASPESSGLRGGRRFHSPRIYARSRSLRSRSPPGLVRSVSEDDGINSRWGVEGPYDGPPKSASLIMGNAQRSPNEDIDITGNQTPISVRSDTRHHRTASHGGSTSGPHRTASFLSEIRPGAILSRSSTRRSFGREWTRSHWEKIRDLEQESERAKRCSKLSSGFAPLMVFGGLVFICIGVSAATNTGKDQERLRNLSAVPMAMGVFMLALGISLIAIWFGCNGRSKNLDQQLLHGSRRNSVEDNLVQSLLSKLHANAGAARAQTSSPILPGVTLDGVDVLKPQSDIETRRQVPQELQCPSESSTSGCCRQCGASANESTHVVSETSI